MPYQQHPGTPPPRHAGDGETGTQGPVVGDANLKQRAAAGQASVRRHNLSLLLRHVSATGSCTRAKLATTTGLTKATVSRLVAELMAAGLLAEPGTQISGATGRPGHELELDRAHHAGVGLEINVDYTAACVTDLGQGIRYHRVECADNRADAQAALSRLARTATSALEAAGRLSLTPAGIVVALPGIVDPTAGQLLQAPNLGWTDLPVAEILAKQLAVDTASIHLDNEANLAALGELWFGGGRAWGDFVHVSGEIGIGAGIVAGGQIYRGARGFAGEIGHMRTDPGDEPCSCGGRGCLELHCGQEAMLRAAGLPPATPATSTAKPDGPITELLSALRDGKSEARRAVRQAGQHLGTGLANVVNVVDPDTVVLGGMFTPLAPWLLEPFTEGLRSQATTAMWAPPHIAVSMLGPEAAVRGAAGLVIEQIMADPSRVTHPDRQTRAALFEPFMSTPQ